MRLWPVTVALVLGACARIGGGPPPGPAPSLAACGAPLPDVSSWRVVADTTGMTYRLPTGFVERPRDDRYREFRIDQELSGRVTIGFSPSSEHYMLLRRAPSPGMHEMSECVEGPDVGNVIFQAWRTEGGIFRGGRRYDLYEVMVLIRAAPTRTLVVTGGGATPEFQAVVLAIARSVEIDRP